MDIEEIRNKNIRRNQDLLRQLNLDTLHESIARDSKHDDSPKRKRPRKAPSKPTPVAIPTRRSRRLANSPENQEEDQKKEEEATKERLRQERIKKLRSSRLEGDFGLKDIVADTRLGNLLFEDRIYCTKSEPASSSIEVKTEDISSAPSETEFDESTLDVLADLGMKFSHMEPVEPDEEKHQSNKEIRNSLLLLKISEKSDPRDFKLVPNRITSVMMHLATENRLVAGGDTNGNVGFWAPDAEHDSGYSLSLFKPHGRTISRIVERVDSPHQLLTASYDGSCRIIDLCKLKSSQALSLGDADVPVGVSDLAVIDQNLIYLTTLDGQFYRQDMREKLDKITCLRLHDKKIGGFTVNPNTNYQAATASLDRTLRIWDLRNIKPENSVSDFEEEGLSSPHLYGAFSSRLSISNVDWNQNNHLVCNGYDDKIQIFDYSGKQGKMGVITEWSDTFRPPTKDVDENGVPFNLKSFKSISHNCQTGRWVSILKARWQKKPADGFQKFAIANMNRSIDIFLETGEHLANLLDYERLTAVPAVIAIHPTQNWVVGGTASGKVCIFE